MKMFDAISDARNLLHYLRSLGIESFPRPSVAAANSTEPPFNAPVSPLSAETSPATADAGQALQAIRARLGDCKRCPLCASRSNIVFGAGNPAARVVFVAEWPKADEDRAAEPFSGETGALFDRMLAAIKLRREEVFLTCAVKCRPPSPEQPPPAEAVAACLPFLVEQIMAVRPAVICAMGGLGAQALLGERQSIIALRGRFHQFRDIPLLATFHPEFISRNPEMKKSAWVDLQMLQQRLGK